MLGTAGLASGLGLNCAVHAAGSDLLRVGLVGCGGRGSGAAVNAPMPTRARSWWQWPTLFPIAWRAA